MSVPKSGLCHSMASLALVAWLPVAPAQAPQKTPAAPEMTITGCLRSGPNPSGVPDSITYTLEPIETAPAPSPSAVDASKPKSATRYSLAASQSIELKAHVGHKVEITGRLKDLSSAEKPVPGDQPTTAPRFGGAHNTFEVAALKMIAPKCP